MHVENYYACRDRVLEFEGDGQIRYYQTRTIPADTRTFIDEATWVIIGGGMRYTVARRIEARVFAAIREGRPISEAFGNQSKVRAIEHIRAHGDGYLGRFQATAHDPPAAIEGLQQMPWIGPALSYHLGKNCGLQVAKPDRHLVRLADTLGDSVQGLCERLAGESGDPVPAVDYVLFRSCERGWLEPRHPTMEDHGTLPHHITF